jgi:integrase
MRRSVARRRVPKTSDIDEFRDKLLSDYDAKHASRSTIIVVTWVFRILTAAGITRLADVNDRGVARFQAALDTHFSHVAPRTRAHYFRTFRRICRRGVEMGVLPSTPKFPRISRPEDFANVKVGARLTRDDGRRLLSHLQSGIETWKGHRLYALIVTAMFTGLFRNELRDLRVDDVNLETGLVRVRRRERFARTIHPTAVQLGTGPKGVLKSWMTLTGCEWLFPGVERKSPWVFTGAYPHAAADQIRDAGLAVGISKLSFLSFRRFYEDNVEHSLSHVELLVDKRQKQKPSVRISGPSDPVFIRGISKGVLPAGQHKAVSVLVAAFPAGLTMRDMEAQTGMAGWRTSLLRLKADDPDWGVEIIFPSEEYDGKKSQFYRIRKY